MVPADHLDHVGTILGPMGPFGTNKNPTFMTKIYLTTLKKANTQLIRHKPKCFIMVRSLPTFWAILGPFGPILRGLGPFFLQFVEENLCSKMWFMWLAKTLGKPIEKFEKWHKPKCFVMVRLVPTFWAILGPFGPILRGLGPIFLQVVELSCPFALRCDVCGWQKPWANQLKNLKSGTNQTVLNWSGQSRHFEPFWDHWDQFWDVWDHFFDNS